MKCFFSVLILLIYNAASAQLNADFSAAITQGCSPLSVQFTDNSSGEITSWFWDFGNGTTSSLQNPSVTYTTSGNYSVRLIIRNSTEQDFEEKDNYITVFATPAANFNVISGDSGCISLQSAFEDTTNFFNTTVKSWLWDFDDGTTSSLQNPTHTFTAAGKYNVSLTVETAEGCSASIKKNGIIKAGNKPVADFSATPLTGCASTIRNFDNKSAGNITASLWYFGDGGTSSDKNPKYHYQDTGSFNVKLKVYENGCADSSTIPKYVHVDGPVAKMVTRINCGDRFTIKFFDSSIGEVTSLWDFGDGQTSTDKNITYVYSSPGIYTAKLIIDGSACSDTATETFRIKVATPVLQISPVKNFYCKFDTIQFTTVNYDTVSTGLFYWHFGDSIVRSGYNNSISYSYTDTGNFIPYVTLHDDQNCKEDVNLSHNIVINGPTAGFSLDTTGCANANVAFKDTSTAAGSKIIQWLWSYGDGITATTNGSSSYNYAYPGIYDVKLNLTDANNCVDSVTHTVNISSSPIVDAGLDTFACAGSDISLNPTGASSYIWKSNPDLSCTNCINPIATPTQTSIYYVTGTTNGCSASDSVNVEVQTKELITVQPNSYSICAGDSVMLNASGAGTYSWTPANTLSDSSIFNPIASPAMNTAYTVIGKDSNNCFSDIAVVNVNVNPNPTVNINDSSVQILIGSSYTIATTASADAQNPLWSPAIDLSCYNCFQPVATIAKTATYTLKVSNQYGCVDSDKITIVSVCTNESVFMPNTFSPNNDGMNDYFFPRTGSDINIVSLTIFNRWGQTVFQKRNFSSNNSASGWDGKYKNVLQSADVYVYVMALQCSGNTVFLKKGNVTLIR